MCCTLVHLRPNLVAMHSHVLKSRSLVAPTWASRAEIHVHNRMPPSTGTYSARIFSGHPHICRGPVLPACWCKQESMTSHPLLLQE